MTEAEKLILSEIKDLRGEMRDDILLIHKKIDTNERNIHEIDLAMTKNSTKLAVFYGFLTIAFSGITSFMFNWIKSK